MLYYNPYQFKKKQALSLDFPISSVNYANSVNAICTNSDGSIIYICLVDVIMKSEDSGETWKSLVPGNAFKTWTTIKCSSDGTFIIVAALGGRIYTSSNSGADWTERQPGGDADLDWKTVDTDSTGLNLIAGIYGGRLYTSSNYGVSWIERQPAGNVDANWVSVCSDSDGSNLVACVYSGRLYTSSNSGVSWTERQPAGDADKTWGSVTSDSDGSDLVVAVSGYGTGRLYISKNSGVSWSELQPRGDSGVDWKEVTIDSDGTNIVACLGNGYYVMVSNDSGATWNQRTVLASQEFEVCAISSSGNIVLTGSSHYLGVSINSGASYSMKTPAKYSYVYFLDDVFQGSISSYPSQIIDDIYKINMLASETNGLKILISNSISNTITYNSLLVNSEQNSRDHINYLAYIMKHTLS